MSAHSLLLWLAWVRAADRDTLALMATLNHALPWWGRGAAAVVRDGPLVALYLWLLNFLLLAPGEAQTRAAQTRALTAGLVLGAIWAVAWAVVPLGPYSRGFAPSPSAEAAVAALPLGAALLALGDGDGGGPAGLLLRLEVVAYALARLAIGADGPLRVLAEAASAVVASLILAPSPALRAPLDDAAARLSRSLGVSARPVPASGRR